MTIEQDKVKYSEKDQIYWRKKAEKLTFGQIIRAHRLCEEWSLTSTAEQLGISKQQLSDYEKGRKLPSLEKAYQMAKVLGMLPEGLVLRLINEQLRRSSIPIRVQIAS